jgi:hypothetical protein
MHIYIMNSLYILPFIFLFFLYKDVKIKKYLLLILTFFYDLLFIKITTELFNSVYISSFKLAWIDIIKLSLLYLCITLFLIFGKNKLLSYMKISNKLIKCNIIYLLFLMIVIWILLYIKFVNITWWDFLKF